MEASMLTEAFKSLVAAGPVAMVLGLVAWALWKQNKEGLSQLLTIMQGIKSNLDSNTHLAEQLKVLQTRLDEEVIGRREDQKTLYEEQKDILKEVMLTCTTISSAVDDMRKTVQEHYEGE